MMNDEGMRSDDGLVAIYHMDRIEDRFVFIHRALITNPYVSDRAVRIYAFLHAQGLEYADLGEVARTLSLSEESVKSALNELEEMGYMKKSPVYDVAGNHVDDDYDIFQEPQRR